MSTDAAAVPRFRTERLLLREWRDADREPFAAMNSDPAVMEHFPSTLSTGETDAFVDLVVERWREGGPSWWAVEVLGGPSFIGFVGLAAVYFDAPFTPAVEIGWRLAADQWGQGYAPEAALAALRFGFTDRGLDEIVSFTVDANSKSRRVMEKIGMRHDRPGDFVHPSVPIGSPLQHHVLYRITRSEWTAAGADTGRAQDDA